MLLIVGHMRAGSTLLLHLLSSHDEISGAGELHLRYRRHHDFARAAWSVYEHLRLPALRGSWVLDKVLHDYLDDPALLAKSEARLIFLLRHPREALPSILDRGLELAPDPEGALRYYCARLESCRVLARTHPGSLRMTLTYEELVSDTERALTRLTDFLQLPDPLRATYDYLPTTGRHGLGDTSSTIWAGRVVQRGQRSYRSTVDESLVIDAESTFQKTLDALRG